MSRTFVNKSPLHLDRHGSRKPSRQYSLAKMISSGNKFGHSHSIKRHGGINKIGGVKEF